MRKAIMAAAVLVALGGACSDPPQDLSIDSPVPTRTESSAATPAASVATSAPKTPGADCTDLSGGAPIVATDNIYTPACVIMNVDQGFSVRNDGANVHNFSVEGTPNVDSDIQPGDPFNSENPGIAAGTYTFFCKYHRATGMEGELQVKA